jgi:Sulfotransferase family
MLGQNPDAYGVPELNLFLADELKALVEELTGYRQIQLHGLLRIVSHLYSGEQTLKSLEMARRWMLARLDQGTSQVYVELCKKVAPLRIVDKSPVYSLKPEYLDRINKAFPEAYYLHLVRHPRTQGESIMKVAKGLMAILANSIDYTTDPPTIDPQISWVNIQHNILDFLQKIPEERKLQMHGEIMLNKREKSLVKICQWLGMSHDEHAIDAMLHPEDSPFACLGPLGAHLGNDINFLRSPGLRDGEILYSSLEGALPWRSDGKTFSEDTLKIAAALGYE